jgi:hypothetical protein
MAQLSAARQRSRSDRGTSEPVAHGVTRPRGAWSAPAANWGAGTANGAETHPRGPLIFELGEEVKGTSRVRYANALTGRTVRFLGSVSAPGSRIDAGEDSRIRKESRAKLEITTRQVFCSKGGVSQACYLVVE